MTNRSLRALITGTVIFAFGFGAYVALVRTQPPAPQIEITSPISG